MLKWSIPHTSIPVVFQRPLEWYPCGNVSSRRRRQGGLIMPHKRPFAELPLQCLKLVDKLVTP